MEVTGTQAAALRAVAMRRATLVAVLVFAVASPTHADRQSIAPGTGRQSSVVVDAGANGVCETTARPDDIQEIAVGHGSPFEDGVRCGPDRIASTVAGGDDVQRELHAWLKQTGKTWLPAGSIVCTGPGPLAANGCRLLVHAVAIDALYQTDEETVRRTLSAAFQTAADRGMQTLALPALATGYGPLSIREFCAAARPPFQSFLLGPSTVFCVAV